MLQPKDIQHYDLAVLGGGLAGLSLLYHLGQAGHLARTRVLCVDPAGRKRNYDRTWSYWERGDGPFEQLVHHRWEKVWVANRKQTLDLDLGAFTYKQIRSSDFYEYIHAYLDDHADVTWLTGVATDITSDTERVRFRVGETSFCAPIAYSSVPLHLRAAPPKNFSAPYLDQHFRGWVIRTPQPTFDPGQASLMDFRTPQHGETRFVYVLPTSATEALVEATVFSNTLLTEAEYDRMMRNYLAEFWTNDYEIEHVEQGVIPMTTEPFPLRDHNLIYIGMWAGATRPSTGYTFSNLQRQMAEIAKTFPNKLTAAAWPKRHLWYDATVLRILDEGRLPGNELFVDLFAANPPARVLAFLNGETGLREELALMSTTKISVFGKAFVQSVL